MIVPDRKWILVSLGLMLPIVSPASASLIATDSTFESWTLDSAFFSSGASTTEPFGELTTLAQFIDRFDVLELKAFAQGEPGATAHVLFSGVAIDPSGFGGLQWIGVEFDMTPGAITELGTSSRALAPLLSISQGGVTVFLSPDEIIPDGRWRAAIWRLIDESTQFSDHLGDLLDFKIDLSESAPQIRLGIALPVDSVTGAQATGMLTIDDFRVFGAAIPAPATAVILGVGGVFALSRRRPARTH